VSSNAVVLSVVAGYLALCLFVGLRARSRASDTAAGYVAGDRSLGTLVMYFITGATIFSAFAFLGAPGRALTRGAGAFYILAFGTLGFVPFYFLGPRAARLGRAFGFVTQGEMVAARFRMPVIAGCMALMAALAFVPYLAIQMKGAGLVLNAATGGVLPIWAGAAITYAVVLVYVLSSGVLGVGWTNTLQGMFMMVLAWVLGLYLPHALYGGVGEMFQRIAAERPDFLRVPGLTGAGEPWTVAAFSSDVLVSILGFSFWPHLFMKAFTARSDAVLRRTVVLYPTFQLFLVPLLIVGFCGVLFSTRPDDPDQILPHILMNMPELPAVVVGLFCAGALAASMSSGDAIAHASASILVRDGLVTGLGRDLDSRSQRRVIRWFVLLVMLAAYSLALSGGSTLVGLLLYAYGPIVQFMPAVVAAMYVRRATGPGVLAGLVAGIGTNILLVVSPELRPVALHAGLYGLVANVAALTLVSALTAGSRDDERFLEAADG
jgi:SSS family solute:Na+ symporter